MKNCPQCGNTFSDELNYCLDDGTALIYETDPEKTIPFTYHSEEITAQQTVSVKDAPTQIIPPAPSAKDVYPKKSSKWLYLTIGIVAASFAAAAFLFFTFGNVNNFFAASDNTNLTPDGNWAGDWNSNNTTYTATAKFEEKNGEVSGQIVWTLKRTTNPKKIDKVGTSAVEFVEGKYDLQTKLLSFHGVRKNDPNEIVILDKYNLSLSDDNQTLMGASINGRFILKR